MSSVEVVSSVDVVPSIKFVSSGGCVFNSGYILFASFQDILPESKIFALLWPVAPCIHLTFLLG